MENEYEYKYVRVRRKKEPAILTALCDLSHMMHDMEFHEIITYMQNAWQERQITTTKQIIDTLINSIRRMEEKQEVRRKENEAKGPNPRKVSGKTIRSTIYKPCVVCGATENICIDHIIPISKGGTSHPKNLQTLCMRCNGIKGTHLWSVAHIRSKLRQRGMNL
jgi:5-methylcytosine-specific restriction endonuclease McrA